MSAETLHRAAALIREQAEAASPSPWEPHSHTEDRYAAVITPVGDWPTVCKSERRGNDKADRNAAHIASWHPAVALAVADWLDVEARAVENGNYGSEGIFALYPMSVALAYLGESE